MKTIDPRFAKIVQMLYERNTYISANQLASFFHVSSKTISRAIQQYTSNPKELEEFGFHILSRQRYGYCIEIIDKQKFSEFQKIILGNTFALDQDSNRREVEIIKILLVQDDYITIQEIADKLYVSDATISSDIRSAKQILHRYDIQVMNKPSKGIRLDGSEMSIRLCYSKYFINHNQDDSDIYNWFECKHNEIEFIRNTVLETLDNFQVHMSDMSREHLISHILVSLHRMKKGKFITFDLSEIDSIKETREYIIAKAMVDILLEKFEVIDAQEETVYVAIQLLGKRSLSGQSQQYQLAKDIEDILYEIFDEIKEKLDIDLTADVEVFNYLAMHFEPMFARLKYGIKSMNPLTEEVKNQHPTSFEMGLIAKQVILDHYEYVLDDAEVSFLAMYFSLALARLKYLQKPKNILVVCGLGVCSSRILVYKLRQQYGEYINDVLTCQFHELRHIALKRFDCIISTINKPIATNLPVIYIDDFLNDLKDKELDDFFLHNNASRFHVEDYLKKEFFFRAETMKNEEEAIDFILDKMEKLIDIPKALRTNILEREALSSTAFGNYCALPHPIKMCSEETFFAMLLLNKSMIWGGKKVKCIFLLSPSKRSPKDLRSFNELLAQFIMDEDRFAKFTKELSFESLYENLGQISNNT